MKCKSYSHFFSKNNSVYAIFNDQEKSKSRDGEMLMLIHDKDYFVLVLIYYTKVFNDQSFNDTLTNNIISFEQLGPGRRL